MRRNFGTIRRANIQYRVYESTQSITNGNLVQITNNNLGDLFDGQHANHHATNICTNGNYRIDKQNQHGDVAFPNIGGGARFDNISVQSGNDSIGVLYVQTGFMETFSNPNNGDCGASMNELRGMFGHYRNNNTEDGEVLLLRMLYTWLCVSNRVNRKIVICSNVIALQNPVNPALVDPNLNQIKQRAKHYF